MARFFYFSCFILVAAFSAQAKAHGKSRGSHQLGLSAKSHAFEEAFESLSKLEYDVQYLRLLEELPETLEAKIQECIGVPGSNEDDDEDFKTSLNGVTDEDEAKQGEASKVLEKKSKIKQIRALMRYAKNQMKKKVGYFSENVGRTKLTVAEMSCAFLNAIANIQILKQKGASQLDNCKTQLKTLITDAAKNTALAAAGASFSGQIAGSLGGGALGGLISAGLQGADGGTAAVVVGKLGSKAGKRFGKILGRNAIAIMRYFNPINAESGSVPDCYVSTRATINYGDQASLAQTLAQQVESSLNGLEPSKSLAAYKRFLKKQVFNKSNRKEIEDKIDAATTEDSCDQIANENQLNDDAAWDKFLDTDLELSQDALDLFF